MSTFSEYGHVAYQIKENDACRDMVANILPVDPHFPHPGRWGQKVKIQILEHSHVAYQIKVNHECSNLQEKIMSLYTPSTPRSSPVACQINGDVAQSPYTHPRPLVGSKRRNIFY